MIISPPFLPAPDADDDAFVRNAMPDAIDYAPGSGGAPLGSYPLTTALTWHNGLHIDAPHDRPPGAAPQPSQRLPVRAIADGTVIFRQDPSPPNTRTTDPQNYNPYGDTAAWTDNGIVIVRHTTDIGASGNTAATATTLTYFSVYMHLARIDAAVVDQQPIWRKDAIGVAGSIYGRPSQIHFEICMNAGDLQKLVGPRRPITWTDPATPPTSDGRTDAVFGTVYVYLRAGTPTSTTAPTSHLGSGSAAPSATNSLQAAQWVGITYRGGSGSITSYRASDGPGGLRVGDVIGQPVSEPDFEYNLYAEANLRHSRLGAAVQATSSPSGWYELLRFGRNLGPDPLPANAAHWRQIPTATGTVWADLNAPGTFKFSDADFPAFLGWQCFGDDTDHSNQRCDSIDLKRSIRDPQAPETIRQRAVLARRLGDAGVRRTLARAICLFPTEWDRSTVATRYGWLKTDDEFRLEPGKGWEEFEAHCKALSFDGLPEEYKKATWHLHPRTFISHMQMCWWLSEMELRQIYPAASTNNILRYRVAANQTIRKYSISNPRRLAHFFGQAAVETNQFQWMSELFNGDPFTYFRNYEKAKNYDGWLGNVEWDDGGKFRGRGFKQLTGRANYAAYWLYKGWLQQGTFGANWWRNPGWWGLPGNSVPATLRSTPPIQNSQSVAMLTALMRPPHVNDPDRVGTDPIICIDTAGWFWAKNRLLAIADADDIAGMTRSIRGDSTNTGVSVPWPKAAHFPERSANTKRIKTLMENIK